MKERIKEIRSAGARSRKVCFVSSSGGHLEELSRLAPLMKEGDFVLTERSEFDTVKWFDRVFYTSQINRMEWLFLPKFAALFVKSFRLLLKEKPGVIVSTGALVTYPICLLGKLTGRKVIYIESFARVDHASLTGKLIYKIADVFIVQWEEMLKVFPNAVYGGGIF